MRNDSYIFSLDSLESDKRLMHPTEINFIHGIDQLMIQNKFVDTGFLHRIFAIDKAVDKAKPANRKDVKRFSLLTNENVSIFFAEI